MTKNYIIELSIDSEKPISNVIISKLKFALIKFINNYLKRFYSNNDTIIIKTKSIGEIIDEETKTNTTTTK